MMKKILGLMILVAFSLLSDDDNIVRVKPVEGLTREAYDSAKVFDLTKDQWDKLASPTSILTVLKGTLDPKFDDKEQSSPINLSMVDAGTFQRILQLADKDFDLTGEELSADDLMNLYLKAEVLQLNTLKENLLKQTDLRNALPFLQEITLPQAYLIATAPEYFVVEAQGATTVYDSSGVKKSNDVEGDAVEGQATVDYFVVIDDLGTARLYDVRGDRKLRTFKNVWRVNAMPEYFVLTSTYGNTAEKTATVYGPDGSQRGGVIRNVKSVHIASDYFIVVDDERTATLYDSNGLKKPGAIDDVSLVRTAPQYFVVTDTRGDTRVYGPDGSQRGEVIKHAISLHVAPDYFVVITPSGPLAIYDSNGVKKAILLKEEVSDVAVAPHYFVTLNRRKKTATVYDVEGVRRSGPIDDVDFMRVEPGYFVVWNRLGVATVYDSNGKKMPVGERIVDTHTVKTEPDYFVVTSKNRDLKIYRRLSFGGDPREVLLLYKIYRHNLETGKPYPLSAQWSEVLENMPKSHRDYLLSNDYIKRT